jgi:hypothetical protein
VEPPRLGTFSFDVGEYHCVARALSIGEWESLQERAFLFLGADLQEEAILSCLLEPQELIDHIVEGDIVSGIPLYIFEVVIAHSGFSVPTSEREAVLQQAREYISTSVLDSMKIMVMASGVMSYQEISKLTMTEMIEMVAIAESVLLIQQQNFLAAMGGGQPLQLTWETPDPTKRKHEEAIAKMGQKAAEVQGMLDSQTAMRPGRGMRMMPPDHMSHT